MGLWLAGCLEVFSGRESAAGRDSAHWRARKSLKQLHPSIALPPLEMARMNAKATGRAGIEPAQVRYGFARAWPLGDGRGYFSLFSCCIYCRASCFVFWGSGVAGGEGGGDGRAAGVAVEEGGENVEGEVEVDDPRAGG